MKAARRRLCLGLLLFSLLVSGLAPGTVSQVAAAEVRISFAAGCHTGYRFDAGGAVTASLTRCLSRASGAPATGRTWIDGRGVHFPITAGAWAGYMIRETPRSYVPGFIATAEFPVPERRSFATGLYVGYAFDTNWTVATAASTKWLNRPSGASVRRHAVINGQYYYLFADGSFAGQWVKAQGYNRSGPQMQYGPNPPTCRIADVLTARRGYEHWASTLLDTEYMLSSGYAPSDLVATSTLGLNGGYSVRRHVATDLAAFASAARAAGRPLQVVSAYRSYSTQVAIFNDNVAKYGYAYAVRRSARPGHSEHQLGTTLDLTHAGGSAPWNYTDWATHPTGAWVRDNAWRYGFLVSYPKGAEAKVCYDYEPWHVRYVGRTVAAQVRESGLTLREWIWRRYGR